MVSLLVPAVTALALIFMSKQAIASSSLEDSSYRKIDTFSAVCTRTAQLCIFTAVSDTGLWGKRFDAVILSDVLAVYGAVLLNLKEVSQHRFLLGRCV